jgi:hypothetical protein
MMKKVVRVSIIGCLICLLGVIGLPTLCGYSTTTPVFPNMEVK